MIPVDRFRGGALRPRERSRTFACMLKRRRRYLGTRCSITPNRKTSKYAARVMSEVGDAEAPTAPLLATVPDAHSGPKSFPLDLGNDGESWNLQVKSSESMRPIPADSRLLSIELRFHSQALHCLCRGGGHHPGEDHQPPQRRRRRQWLEGHHLHPPHRHVWVCGVRGGWKHFLFAEQ